MVELVFLMLILKLPILYLVGVVYWAVKAEPLPPEPEVVPVPVPAANEPPPLPRRFPPRRPRRGGPHGQGRAARRAARLPLR